MAGFTKLFSGLIHSTVWREEMHVKVVWITMLAMADRHGRVLASLPGLADASRVSLEQCEDALRRLKAPDKHSRTKAHQGRRIEECEGGWLLLNYLKYRQMRDDENRRQQVREAVARHRQRVSDVSRGKPIAEAEAEAETEERRSLPASVRGGSAEGGDRIDLRRRIAVENPRRGDESAEEWHGRVTALMARVGREPGQEG